MERSKREHKPLKRLIEQMGNEPVKEKVKPVAKKQSARKQPQKPAEAPKSPLKTSSKTPNAPAKTKKTDRRVLSLDLPDVPPSEYEKYVEDWSLPDNPFWRDNLYLKSHGSRIIRYKGAVYCKKMAFAAVVNFVAKTKVPTNNT